MSGELKPCPWCGDKMTTGATVVEASTFRWRQVAGCCTPGPEVRHDTMANDQAAAEIDSTRRAIEAWNNRHGAGDAEAWRPIESAPFADLQHTHPTDCLVWSPKIGGVRLGRVWRYPDGEPCGQAVGYNGEWEITHWRPLPVPPTDDAARAGERG